MTVYIEENFLGSYRIKLDPSYILDRYIIENGAWETHVVQLINNFVRPGNICVDVGANAGYHTLAMAGAAGKEGHVYAFEPNDISHDKLIENIALNESFKNRITCERLGLSFEENNLKIFQSGNAPGNAYLSPHYREDYWNAGTSEDFTICKVIRLDSYIKPETSVSLIKVDVEGMELEVLTGADAVLKRDMPVILFETLLENFSHESIKQLEEYLVSLGYVIFNIDNNLGRLKPVSYPDFDVDSIAIAKSRLAEYQI